MSVLITALFIFALIISIIEVLRTYRSPALTPWACALLAAGLVIWRVA